MDPQPYEVTHVLIEKLNKLKVIIQGLEKENEKLQLSLNRVTREKNDMKLDLNQKAK